MSTNITIKCRYFNRGFCGKRDQCEYTHLNEDCKDDCMDSQCPYRHRVTCQSGIDCYYNKRGICKFKHRGRKKYENHKKTRKYKMK